MKKTALLYGFSGWTDMLFEFDGGGGERQLVALPRETELPHQ
ncbi:hypothetical protein [Caballeronia sp. AZ10_KS36]|nr:hypothetical protein [Caballeronia sp. AZ10_KS36]